MMSSYVLPLCQLCHNLRVLLDEIAPLPGNTVELHCQLGHPPQDVALGQGVVGKIQAQPTAQNLALVSFDVKLERREKNEPILNESIPHHHL